MNSIMYFHALFLFLLLLFNNGVSQSVIGSLPGYPGTLPFKLETGYIGVGENEEVQLFYYFVESENKPETDPLFLWITGGPGCSGLSTLVYEIGPFTFDVADFSGSLPSILLNPNSWTKVANIIFIDWIVGTGFSYTNTSEGYSSSDSKSAINIYTFLQKWLSNHPMFNKNHLYIGGASYGGKLVPMVTMEILRGNGAAGQQPRMSLQGYIIGNGLADPNIDFNERIPYAHRMALISDKYFESAKISCNGKYYNHDPNNMECLHALKQIEKCTNGLNGEQILEPKCVRSDQTFSKDDSINYLVLPTFGQDQQWCRDDVTLSNHRLPCQLDVCLILPMGEASQEFVSLVQKKNYITSYVWANDPTVQEALHVRKGTTIEWQRCNENTKLYYAEDVANSLQYHKILSQKGYNVLAYSGDHDMFAPYTGTLKWIALLNLTIDDEWRPWHVNGQVAGYTQKYKQNDFHLTFATVKGAGHTAAEYKPQECLAMVQRWLSLLPV